MEHLQIDWMPAAWVLGVGVSIVLVFRLVEVAAARTTFVRTRRLMRDAISPGADTKSPRES